MIEYTTSIKPKGPTSNQEDGEPVIPGAALEWALPAPPESFKSEIKARCPKIENVDNPKTWNSCDFQPKYEKKGMYSSIHTTAAVQGPQQGKENDR